MRRRKRHAIEMRRSWNIALRVDVGSACVDRGQSPLTYLLLLFLLLYTIYGVIVILQRWLLTCVEMVQKLVNRVPSFSTEAVVCVRSTFLWRILWLLCRVWFLIECKDYRVSFHVSPPVKKADGGRRTGIWRPDIGLAWSWKDDERWCRTLSRSTVRPSSHAAGVGDRWKPTSLNIQVPGYRFSCHLAAAIAHYDISLILHDYSLEMRSV